MSETKCPILTAKEKGINFGVGRVIECINCPTKLCFDEIKVVKGESRAQLFYEELQDTIKELDGIAAYTIHEYGGAG